MTRKQRRLYLVAIIVIAAGIAAALVLNALEDSVSFFYSPKDIAAATPAERAGKFAPGKAFRLGGLVAENSFEEQGDDMEVRFTVVDSEAAQDVTYTGILPDLFREGQGVIAEGALAEDGTFKATRILAKHDENYMPPEVAKALEKTHEDAGVEVPDEVREVE